MSNTYTEITVQTTVKASIEYVWKLWTTPADIIKWNNPSNDWHNVSVELDLKDGGNFLFRMRTKDGSDGFDYSGKYDKVEIHALIELTTSDGRKSINRFIPGGDKTIIVETFQAEAKTPIDIQRDFCQRVLNSFKKYAEEGADIMQFIP